jgi:hypothetical protein
MSARPGPTAPAKLKATQEWFASIITRPLLDESKMILTAPNGEPMELDAARYLLPGPTLEPHQRIELYNQRYWWRLLAILHESFPLVTRLFGFYQFNQLIGFPYLVKYPPTHWSLNYLGSHLFQWVEEEYQAEDKQLILDSAKLDWAFNDGFTAAELPPITTKDMPADGNLEALLDRPIILQPYIHLFELDYDLFLFREAFIKEEGDYWVDHDFPPLLKEKKPYCFALYRTERNQAAWKEISQGEYLFLNFFKQGMSIEEACEQLESCPEEVLNETMNNLHKWFQEWILRRWLVLK